MSNTNLHINLAQPPSEQLIKYLQNLPSHQKARVLAALAGPEDRIKSILLDFHNSILFDFQLDQPGPTLTKEELTIAIKDCYKSIVLNRMDWNYASAIIGAVNERAFNNPSWAHEGAEQLIFLAARLIKGEGCEDHPTYKSPGGSGAGCHRDFADAIGDLEELGAEKEEFTYSDKARFALDKLLLMYPDEYAVVPICGSARESLRTSHLQEEFEQMWCHDNEDCRDCDCWDVDSGSWQGHGKGCVLYSL
jgi:hypothetical protein